jgi:hypothetical protein
MQADTLTLASLLSLGALIGATIEYAEIIRRRARQRFEDALRKESGDFGLRGLVRVFMAEEPSPEQ